MFDTRSVSTGEKKVSEPLNQNKRNDYEPPRLEVVSFRADEVLAGVCAGTEEDCGIFGPAPYEVGS